MIAVMMMPTRVAKSRSLNVTHRQNGPMLLHPDFTISQNPYSLSDIMDTVWIDQPGESETFGSA
jgi:hypothetical protein